MNEDKLGETQDSDSDTVDGFRRVWARSGELEVAVLPELGGKIQTIRLRGNDHNVLLAPPEFRYRRPQPFATFEDFDTSGFDECFPTVSPCASPDFAQERQPDHGELWSAPWTWSRHGPSVLAMEAGLTGRPWRFKRQLSVQGRTLKLEYELTSPSDRELQFLWSAHPLLTVSEGSRIYLPSEVQKVLVESSVADGLGPRHSEIAWPEAAGRRLDVLAPPSIGMAHKLFTDRVTTGACAFHDRASDVSVTFRFNPSETPYIGLWICEGGWPTSRPAKHYTVGLEPCSGRPDALDEAARRNESSRLGPGETKRWVLELDIGLGAPAL